LPDASRVGRAMRSRSSCTVLSELTVVVKLFAGVTLEDSFAAISTVDIIFDCVSSTVGDISCVVTSLLFRLFMLTLINLPRTAPVQGTLEIIGDAGLLRLSSLE